MIKWIRTSRLSIKNSLSLAGGVAADLARGDRGARERQPQGAPRHTLFIIPMISYLVASAGRVPNICSPPRDEVASQRSRRFQNISRPQHSLLAPPSRRYEQQQTRKMARANARFWPWLFMCAEFASQLGLDSLGHLTPNILEGVALTDRHRGQRRGAGGSVVPIPR